MSKHNITLSGLFAFIITATLLGIAAFRPNTLKNDLELTEKGNKIINERLVTPIKQKFKFKMSKSESFSRCPSGTSFYVQDYPTNENPYFTGKVSHYKACKGIQMCEFRLSDDESQLEVWDENKRQFTSPEKWLAKASMPSEKKLKNDEDRSQKAEGRN
ncbi:MAG: hypothetical protein EAZ85_02055 [Bacteroidetes bacterium]|nr:MAG: hypothetical protein EAZ85_02055 [Bacteroidota bacterium]TAG86927.1 MAG: hypothetical protein EAZ20_11750 [Bacteroidota bacterium]